jgi:hypothetical protein
MRTTEDWAVSQLQKVNILLFLGIHKCLLKGSLLLKSLY